MTLPPTVVIAVLQLQCILLKTISESFLQCGKISGQLLMDHMFLVARPSVMLKWGPMSPFSKGEWEHGSLYSQENGDPGPHTTGKNGTRSPHFPGNMGIPW